MKTYTNLKIALTSILFLVCSISGYMVGQTSSDEGISTDGESNSFRTISPKNSWTSYTYNPMTGSNVQPRQYRFHEDSVEVGGNWYFQLQWSNSEEGENWSDLELFREENGKIFVLKYGDEYILMDFNVEAGETFSIEQPNGGGWTNNFLVISVDSIELVDGSQRKRVGLGCYEEDVVWYYWVEGIGSLTQNLDLYHCALDVPHDPILCFYHNGELIFSDDNYDECWITTSVTDIQAQGINIYPNPTTDFLTIEFGDPPTQDIMFTVYDYTGKLIRNFQHSGFQSHYRIEVSDFSPGFYYLSWEQNGIPYSYRFVVGE